jgi:mono/diheme cytochrome c family protein
MRSVMNGSRGAAMAGIVAMVVIAAGAASAAEPSAKRGRALYMTTGCVHCHGGVGQGSSAGLKLAPDPLPAEAIAQFIRATNTQMPAYSDKVLSDADVADIAAFLATIPPGKSPDDIPALKTLKPGG